MTKKINKKGFTLAELLIVVAIIAVLVAVSIPVFSSQLAKAKLATNQANARAAYAAAIAKQLEDGQTTSAYTYTVATADLAAAASGASATITTPITDWTKDTVVGSSKKAGDDTYDTWTVIITDGKLTGFTAN